MPNNATPCRCPKSNLHAACNPYDCGKEKTDDELARRFKLYAHGESGSTTEQQNAEGCTMIAKEYAEQIAIGFAEWIEGRWKQNHFFSNDDRWIPYFDHGVDTSRMKTLYEIYAIYLTHLNESK